MTTTKDTKTYEFRKGTLVKHFVYNYYASGKSELVYYTVIKNGVESKKYYTVGHAMNFLNKEEA